MKRDFPERSLASILWLDSPVSTAVEDATVLSKLSRLTFRRFFRVLDAAMLVLLVGVSILRT